MPFFRPMIPWIMTSDLDLDVDARGQVETLERVHRLRGGVVDVDQALVDAALELLPRLLVDVRRAVHGVDRLLRGQRHRARNPRPGAFRRADDLRSGAVEDHVIVGAKPDADLGGRGSHRYATISMTTPAPTVRPPSRIAKRSSFSIAIG